MEAQNLKDKVPPHNYDAEVATLGAILLDRDALAKIVPLIRPDDFYKTAHRKICEAMIGLDSRNEAIDLITLTDELTKRKELEACGGISYIAQLTSAVPTSANVEYYAKIVQETSIRRNLERIASGMISDAHNESIEVRVIIEEAEKRIFELTENQHSGTYKEAKEIVNKTIAAIENLFHKKGEYTGVPCNFSELDEMTSGFQESELIVIGARPSVGKTAFALSMAANMCMHIKHPVPVGFFTLEMSSMALMQRLICSESRLNSHIIRTGMLRPADFHNLTEAAGRIYEAPLYIDDTPNIKLLDLRALARRMVAQAQVKIIFIDYLTLISSEHPDIPRHEQIAEISRSLKALARELNVPVIALSQVRRETEGKAPNLADIRESGSIEQDADVVIFLHRERADEKTETINTQIIVAKQRNGPVGTIELAFIPKYTKFESVSHEHHDM